MRMERSSKWFYLFEFWVFGSADASSLGSVMNFLGHEYVKERTREMEDEITGDEEEGSSEEEDVTVDRSLILRA